jgi:hypothetical protein
MGIGCADYAVCPIGSPPALCGRAPHADGARDAAGDAGDGAEERQRMHGNVEVAVDAADHH